MGVVGHVLARHVDGEGGHRAQEVCLVWVVHPGGRVCVEGGTWRQKGPCVGSEASVNGLNREAVGDLRR
eukprot:13444-Eustigmatos_ZCMA.PRE.1